MNVKSWHWRLAKTYGPLRNGDYQGYNGDFCTYSRAVVFGLLKVIFVICTAGLFVSLGVGDFIAWITAMIVSGEFLYPNGPSVAVLTLLSMGSLLVFVVWLTMTAKDMYEQYKIGAVKRGVPEKGPGFFTTWYRSVKDKACFNITVEGVRSIEKRV